MKEISIWMNRERMATVTADSGATSNAKRAAAAHVLFNVLTAAVALLLLVSFAACSPRGALLEELAFEIVKVHDRVLFRAPALEPGVGKAVMIDAEIRLAESTAEVELWRVIKKFRRGQSRDERAQKTQRPMIAAEALVFDQADDL
jgi:hypothetical protein